MTHMIETEIVTVYRHADHGVEAHVAKVRDGYTASLWDSDAMGQGSVGVVLYPSARFDDAEARAHREALRMVGITTTTTTTTMGSF